MEFKVVLIILILSIFGGGYLGINPILNMFNMPSSLPGTGSLSSSSPASISAMSVNEITALVGDKHIDGISNIYWAIIITIIIYAIVTTIKSIIIIGATYIEKLSVAFEEFETYFLAIFENRKRASVNSVYANIINAYQKQLNR